MAEVPQTPIIRAENLVKRFGYFRQITPVDGVSLQINSGEIVALLGCNGAGKSTTFDMLSGLTFPSDGAIFQYDEEKKSWNNITKKPLYQRAKHGICYLPQKPSVFATLTTRQNLLGIMEIMNPGDWQHGMRAYNSTLKTREEFCDALLQEFDLYKRRDEKVCKLSGGEKRRLEIARCFIRKPRLILMDEPYAAVDVAGIEMCSKKLEEVRKKGVSILIIDHRIEEILRICNRAIFLYNGKVHCEGEGWQIVRNKVVEDKLLKDQTERFHGLFPIPSGAMAPRVSFDSTSVLIES